MNRAILLLPAVTALLAACASPEADGGASSASARNARVTPATQIGAPRDCVNIQDIRESRVLSDNVIDFHLNNGTVLRNTLPHGCPQLGVERAFSYQTSLSRLCNVDIITVYRQGSGPNNGASCGLGVFQPVKLEKK